MNDKFERDKVAYEQNCEQFRSLNQTMWQVPVIAMTLTGGLWFGAARVGDMPGFQYLLLLLAVLSNVGLAIVLTRVRHVMGQYLEAMKAFNEGAHVAGTGTGIRAPKTVAITFRTLLIISAIISAAGIGLVSRENRERPATRRIIEVIELSK